MNLEFFDSHCHLEGIYRYLKLPYTFSVSSFVDYWPKEFAGCINVPLYDLGSFDKIMEQGHPKIFSAIGLHPLQAHQYNEDYEQSLKIHLEHPKVRALGEIGLDYYKGKDTADIQKKVFIKQLKIAQDFKLPIVIHSRKASHDTFKILKEYVPADHKIHIHCFSENIKYANLIMDHFKNAYFGFTGKLTYIQCEEVRESCKGIPLNRILAETDSPYMVPVSSKAKLTSPSFIPLIIEKIAELHKVDLKKAYLEIRNNNREMYNI